MLNPRGRQLLLSSLRPPDGFRFDCAVGTTFSLDLVALLTTPLAFAMFDWQDDQGRLAADPSGATADPLALLESLRRCADRVHIYCQAGQIKVPPANQRLLGYLEQSVVEVAAPAAEAGRQAAFHPKVWAVRFVGPGGAVQYRMLCLSRNLTFDRSWDTVLRLDGELVDRQNGFGENRPLSEFIAALPGLATRRESLSSNTSEDTARVADELRRVKWELPEFVEEVRFCPLGLTPRRSLPFDRIDRLLVVSPFLSADLLDRLASLCSEGYLVGRAEELRAMPPSVLARWKCFTLDDGVETLECTGSDNPEGEHPLSGLHAKAYVVDAGWDAHVWTGSANATTAAFSANVEFLVELVGKKSKLGIDAAISLNAETANLRTMLTEFEPPAEAVAPDPDLEKAEALIEAVRCMLVASGLRARIEPAPGGAGVVTLIEPGVSIDLPAGTAARCRPVMLPAADAKPVAAGVRTALSFGPHAPDSISSFVSFTITAQVGEIERASQFVLNLPLTGAPPDRKERLLRELLRDSRTLLRFLLLLLADDPERLFEELREIASSPEGGPGRQPADLLPLLEHLLRALHQSPERIDQVQRLIDDLRKTPEGQSILPPELEQVWGPIGRARSAARGNGGRR
ncbi:MAG: phospholipase D family protein [Phycisphaeraceae bacterium]|nr:phospholipase D family protein [Phycisphaeraceae bacterium]